MFKRFTLLIYVLSFLILSVEAKEYDYEWLSLGMSESPATLQRVRWRTAPEMPVGVAELVPATHSPDLVKHATRYEASSTIEDDYGLVKAYHHVSFQNLAPGTKYLYRIGDGDQAWSEWYEFSTAKTGNEEFSFIYISDVQVGIREHYPRVIRNAIRKDQDASFIMFTGDLTGGASEREWNHFFYANSWIFGMLPVVAIPDSHEYKRKKGETKSSLTTYWDHLFSYPENTPEELLKQGNYYYDYQGCRFVMINTKELVDGSDEYRKVLLDWMEEKLASNPYKWSIIGQHRPVYTVTEGRGADSEIIKDYVKDLYDKYDVDLVLTGHDHIYGRMRGEQNTPGTDELAGPVYIVSIAGSQVYMPDYYTYVERVASNTRLYQIITVGEEAIDFKAYTATGDLYDHFLINKSNNKKSFTDKVEGWPEITEFPYETWKVYTEEEMEDFRNKREQYNRFKAEQAK